MVISAPSEGAAGALLQLLHSGRAGASLEQVPWPDDRDGSGGSRGAGGAGVGAHFLAPGAVVYGATAASESALAGAADVVGVPAGDGGVAGDGTPVPSDGEPRAVCTGGGGAVTRSGLLRPSRLVSFVAGAVVPALLPAHSADGSGSAGYADGAPAAASAGASAAEGQLAHAGLALWRLRVGLTRACFQAGVAEPQDPARRPWQAALLAVTAWLVPHWGAAGGPAAAPGLGGDGCGGGAEAESLPGAALTEVAGPSSSSAAALGAPPAAGGDGEAAPPGGGAAREFDAGVLYEWAKPSGGEARVPLGATPPELLPTLRPYQARAVAWMLQRERAPAQPGLALLCGADSGSGSSSESDSVRGSDDTGAGSPQGTRAGSHRSPLHPLWRCVRALPGGWRGRFYINPFSGLVAMSRFAAPPPVRGECRPPPRR